MFSTTEKAAATTQVVQQKPAGAFFFRKADGEGFFGNKEARPFFPATVQPKLEVSHPDDPQEKEADAVAANVMRMVEPAAASPADEKKEEVQRKEEHEPVVQRAPVVGLISRQGGAGGFASHGRSEDEGAGYGGSGEGLPASARHFCHEKPPGTSSVAGLHPTRSSIRARPFVLERRGESFAR